MRQIAVAASSSISCLALTLLLGCTGHDTYETYYIDGGSTGALASSAAGRAGGGASASAGSNGQAAANSQAGASSSGGEAGTAEGIGGQAGSAADDEGGNAGADECLRSSDCPSGMSCSATGQCVSEPCTDTDCGGTCPPCSDGKKCKTDTDCTSYACDAALHTCATDQCEDHEQDGLETDSDCGGGLCMACALGKSCLVSPDCASQACDGVTLICVNDVCSDHRQDGDETDADCGGSTCDSCPVGKKCRNNLDCTAGHVCAVSKVCQ